MKRISVLLCGFSAGVFGLTACETAPAPPPPVVVMDEAGFETLFAQAERSLSPVAADRTLSRLLSRTDLSEEQRARALYLRGQKRWRGKLNLPGAAADLEGFLGLRPLDVKAAAARTEIGYIRNEVRGHEMRLRGLQTLPDWFDDKTAMGGLSEAAARYKRSGLTPTERQTYTLREAGYICTNASGGQPVHRYGATPAYIQSLVWCTNPPSS